MTGRLFVNVVVLYGRVLSTAWKEAAKKSAAEVGLRNRISVDEAKKILNVSQNPTPEEVQQKFQHLFEANDKSHGSEYLQSKIAQAKDTLDLELGSNLRDKGQIV